jgi:hypothetical protein
MKDKLAQSALTALICFVGLIALNHIAPGLLNVLYPPPWAIQKDD